MAGKTYESELAWLKDNNSQMYDEVVSGRVEMIVTPSNVDYIPNFEYERDDTVKNKLNVYWMMYGRDAVFAVGGFAAGLLATWVF